MSNIKASISRISSREPARGAEGADAAGDGQPDTPRQRADEYRLLVTAGPSYDTQQHKMVRVNGDTATAVENEFMRAKIKVRIRNYRGFPSSSSSTSPYFDHPSHAKDQYSVSFSFIPKLDLPCRDTVWGNDFDHPVRDRLPPGFSYAFRIVKEFVDPGLECDAYADEPWLYGPSLSCWFAFRIGDSLGPDADIPEHDEVDDILQEGSDGTGTSVREKHNLPANNQKRRKFFLSAANREPFVFEKDRLYQGDFFNPYLDFGNLALKLPGFSIRVFKYIDAKSHCLRYVFKNRATGDVYFSVNLNLLWGEQLQQTLRDENAGAFLFETDVRPSQQEQLKDDRDSSAEDLQFPVQTKEVSSTTVKPIDLGLDDKPAPIVEEIRSSDITDKLKSTSTKDSRDYKVGIFEGNG